MTHTPASDSPPRMPRLTWLLVGILIPIVLGSVVIGLFVLDDQTRDAATEQDPVAGEVGPVADTQFPTTPEQAAALFGGGPGSWQIDETGHWQLQEGNELLEITVPDGRFCVDYFDNHHQHEKRGPATVIVAYATIRFDENEIELCGED